MHADRRRVRRWEPRKRSRLPRLTTSRSTARLVSRFAAAHAKGAGRMQGSRAVVCLLREREHLARLTLDRLHVVDRGQAVGEHPENACLCPHPAEVTCHLRRGLPSCWKLEPRPYRGPVEAPS
jgi:hypothetical protein